MYGALPVARLHGFLSEEEVDFVIVSVVVVGDEVSSDEFRICAGRMQRRVSERRLRENNDS